MHCVLVWHTCQSYRVCIHCGSMASKLAPVEADGPSTDSSDLRDALSQLAHEGIKFPMLRLRNPSVTDLFDRMWTIVHGRKGHGQLVAEMGWHVT